MQCPLFHHARSDLFGQLRYAPHLDFSILNDKAISNLFLYSDGKLNIVSNRIILEATISFIDKTKRFL